MSLPTTSEKAFDAKCRTEVGARISTGEVSILYGSLRIVYVMRMNIIFMRMNKITD